MSPPGTEHPDGFRRYGELMVMAMAMQEHLLHDRRHLNVFQRYSQQLTKFLRQAPEEKIRQEVMDLLLKMYLEITGAKVAYYRELRGESLVLASEPVWRGEKPADVEIPKEFHKGDRFSTLLLEKIESGGHLKGDATAEPFFHNDMTERIREALQQAGPGRWSAAEFKLFATHRRSTFRWSCMANSGGRSSLWATAQTLSQRTSICRSNNLSTARRCGLSWANS